MNFEPGEREYLLEMRMLTTDVEGRDVFVGLSVEESEEYFAHSRLGATDRRAGQTAQEHRERVERYQTLHSKMQKAKFDLIAAEHILRTMQPTRN